jgi:hypothetical protein
MMLRNKVKISSSLAGLAREVTKLSGTLSMAGVRNAMSLSLSCTKIISLELMPTPKAYQPSSLGNLVVKAISALATR